MEEVVSWAAKEAVGFKLCAQEMRGGSLKLQRGDCVRTEAAVFHSSQAMEATQDSALLKWPWGN